MCAEYYVLTRAPPTTGRMAGGWAGAANFKGASEGEGAALSDGGFCLLRCSLSPLSTAGSQV